MKLLIAVFLFASTIRPQESPRRSYLSYYGRGMEAYQKKDYAAYLENFREAVKLAPAHPAVIQNLARAHALVGNREEAFFWQDRLSDLGVGHDPGDDPAFATFKSTAEYQKYLEDFRRKNTHVGKSRLAFTIRERDLIPEGIAYDPYERNFYVGSTHKSKIVRIDRTGRVTDFTSEKQDGLWGVLGMKVDAGRRTLWVCSAATPETGADVGYSGVFKYNLRTGKLIKKYVVDNTPQPHLYNDIAIASNGDVYFTDSSGGAVYAIMTEKDEIEALTEPGQFIYPNGITLSGDEKSLFVAHFGGIAAIDLASKAVGPISHPDNVAIAGIDGLYSYRDNLIGIQNLTGAGRVVEIQLSPDHRTVKGLKVLEANNPSFIIPTTGAIVGGDFYFIANSQLRNVNQDGTIPSPEKLRYVIILKATLSGSK